MEEIWKDVAGYEGIYKVSNLGNIISMHRGGKLLKPYLTNCGYLQVCLNKNGKHIHKGVHILVAKAFCDGWFEGAEVDHLDMDKTNNNSGNLEWVTHSENQKRQYFHYHVDYKIPTCNSCGREISSKYSKLCLECEKKLRRINWPSKEDLSKDLLTMSYCEIGRKYGKTDNTMRKVCKSYGLPVAEVDVIQYRKDNGTYIPSKNSLRKTKEERYIHYEVDGKKLTATAWSAELGLESKVISRYYNKHGYEATLKHIQELYYKK